MKRAVPAPILLRILWLSLPLSLLLSLCTGVLPVSIGDVAQSLLHSVGLGEPSPNQKIIDAIRWPRTLLAALVGAALALCGAAMQGLFRNPLADPTLIGVASGANVGASLAIVFSISFFGGSALLGFSGSAAISLAACIGGFLTTLLVYRLGRSVGVGVQGISVTTMLLAGIAINALAAAINQGLSFIADDAALRRLSLWKMGGIDGANSSQVLLALIILLPVIFVLPRFSRELNALLLGESEARHLGIAVDKLKLKLIVFTAVGVGISVSLTGMIGFVGLVVPHIVRLLSGPDHRHLLVASALLGAILLLLADCAARTMAAPAEVPVGIVTALIGAPVFIYLLIRHRSF